MNIHIVQRCMWYIRACGRSSTAPSESVWRRDSVTATETRTTSVHHQVLRHRRSRHTLSTARTVRLSSWWGLHSTMPHYTLYGWLHLSLKFKVLSRSLNLESLVFTARRYARAVYAVALCPSVCLSICLSQLWVLPKRLSTGLRKQRHTIGQ